MCGLLGEKSQFEQANGPVVELVTFGDRYHSRYENRAGHTVVYDAALGLYCYAELDTYGQLVSSGKPLHKRAPKGVPKHLVELPAVSDPKIQQRVSEQLPPASALETFGANAGLLTGRQVSQGTVHGLTILVNFQDIKSTITADEVAALLNADNYNGHGNFCSVREYFRRMSNGRLDYANVVIGPVQLSQPREFYIDNLLAKEALTAVIDQGIDLAQFDSKEEGTLDAISFMYAGEAVFKKSAKGNSWLWPHNHTLAWQHGNYRAHFYQITALGTRSSDLRIGTFCHESGHMLARFPDLYDYGNRDGGWFGLMGAGLSGGMGRYCLMSSGNHLGDGKIPAPICGYLRKLAGWTTEVELNQPGIYTLKHGDYGTVYLYRTSKPNEYFIVENRSQLGLDQHLPASGLAVYHCDILGSNEWQNNTAQHHYQCGLLQADGRNDLERNKNFGDATDLFRNKTGLILSAATLPSTRLWDNSDSGLRLFEVSAAGETIQFRVEVG